MSLASILRALRRRWWLPGILAAAAVVAIFAITPNVKRAQVQYTAKTILLVNPQSTQTSGVNLSEAALQVTVGAVPQAAASALHYSGNPAVLAARVTVSPDSSVGTLTLGVTDVNGQWAAAVANQFGTSLNHALTATANAAYQAQVQQVQSRLNDLQNQVNQYEGHGDAISQAKLGAAEDQYRLAYDQFQQLAAQGPPQPPFTVLQKAVAVPSGGVHPPRSRVERSLIGGVAGLVVGLALAVLMDLLWPRIDDRIDAEREFGTVVLAEVPRLSRRQRRRGMSTHFNDRALAPFREAYRMLRTSVLLLHNAESSGVVTGAQGEGSLVGPPKVILVTSPLPAEGKSTTVASLAVSMAETGRRVLVLNADFRAPQVQNAFGLSPSPGLTDLLAGENGARHLTEMVHRTNIQGVSFVHSGSEVANAAELIAFRGGQILAEARALADVVLVDTAPLLVVSDATELLPEVDAVIMVARAGRTSRDAARRSFELLDRAGIPVLGVVLVGASSPMSFYYGGHYGAYGYNVGGWRRWLRRGHEQRRVVPVRSERDAVRTSPPWRPHADPRNRAGNGSVKRRVEDQERQGASERTESVSEP